MEPDLLQSIIGVEQELKRTLEQEQQQAAAWLEAIRRECRQQIEQERLRQEEQFQQELAQSRRSAAQEADRLLAGAADLVRMAAALPDEELIRIIQQHLPMILPGPDRREDPDDR